MLHKNTIKNNENKFTYNVNKKWGDLEEEIQEIDNSIATSNHTIKQPQISNDVTEKYDLAKDLQFLQCHDKKKTS